MAIGVDYTSLGAVREETWNSWEWRDDRGLLHRADGPAAISDGGNQYWYLHGQRHRTDGPAIILAARREEWWVHGELHRAFGPAVTYADGRQWWFVQGRAITQEVKEWMHDNNITLPFTPEQRMEFELRWG